MGIIVLIRQRHTRQGSSQGQESPYCSFDTFNDLTITRLEYYLITCLLLCTAWTMTSVNATDGNFVISLCCTIP